MQIKDCFGLRPGCREVCLPNGTQRVVAVEHTTMILVNDQPAFRVVCTPALLPQLALGRLLTEGWIPSVHEVEEIAVRGDGTSIRVRLTHPLEARSAAAQEVASCTDNLPLGSPSTPRPLGRVPQMEICSRWVEQLKDAMGAGLPLYRATRAVHSCLIMHRGEIICQCEDLGRHNALDKAVGSVLLKEIPMAECVLYTSGRVPVDMVRKAIRAGVPVLISKSMPTAQSLDLAAACGLRLMDAASETARRLKETGSMFDGSAAKTGEDVIAAVEKETAALAAKHAAASGAPAGPGPEAAAGPEGKQDLLDFLASAPEAANDPFADQPTVTAPELPEMTPAQELAGYIRSRSAAALVTPRALLVSEVENAEQLLAEMPEDPQCTDIVSRTGAKDTYYYSNANMSDNYAMIAQLIEDQDLCTMMAEMVRFNARIYPSATPMRYFCRSPYNLPMETVEQTWKTVQSRPEFSDIEELTNNRKERFLFSTQYLTRRYAKAISDVDDFCD